MSSQYNDSPDDFTLHTRRGSPAAESVRGVTPEDDRPAEREVTLNTGIVLGLFFALAVLCAVFFGFGYSIGHKSAPVPSAVATSAEPENGSSTETPAAAKPAAGSPASTPVPEYVPSASAERPTPAPVKISVPIAEGDTPRKSTTVPPGTTPANKPVAVAAAPVTAPSAAPTATSSTGAAGTNYVQVAAVSHQEDADTLLSALRRRGYTVQTRTEANDKLIHVQLGPFSSRKDAEAMRQKLAGDGYNAFIK